MGSGVLKLRQRATGVLLTLPTVTADNRSSLVSRNYTSCPGRIRVLLTSPVGHTNTFGTNLILVGAVGNLVVLPNHGARFRYVVA